MKKNIITFYIKSLLLCLPFIMSVGWYMIEDPFMVVRHYKDYDHSHFIQDESAIGWFKYKNQRDSMHYDAFLMGNSNTKGIRCADWNAYIKARPFRLFSNAEGLGDLCLKLDALDHQPSQPVRHLLIVCDHAFFEKIDPRNGFKNVMPPEITGNSWISFQTTFMQSFFTPKFIIAYLKYSLTGKYDKSMNCIINQNIPTRTLLTNDQIISEEDSIRLQGARYWQKAQWASIYDQPKAYEAPIIEEQQFRLLHHIQNFCQRHNTHLMIVITPTYHKPAMAKSDIEKLESIFPPHTVFDFSSNSNYKQAEDFYDGIHFTQATGRRMLKEMYHESPKGMLSTK